MARHPKCEVDRLTRALRLALLVAWDNSSRDNWRAYWDLHARLIVGGMRTYDHLQVLVRRADEDHYGEAP